MCKQANDPGPAEDFTVSYILFQDLVGYDTLVIIQVTLAISYVFPCELFEVAGHSNGGSLMISPQTLSHRAEIGRQRGTAEAHSD